MKSLSVKLGHGLRADNWRRSLKESTGRLAAGVLVLDSESSRCSMPIRPMALSKGRLRSSHVWGHVNHANY